MEVDDREENLAVSRSNSADSRFDMVIGAIEDIVMDEEFQVLQHSFLEKYFHEFDDSEENRFIYTDIHTEYVNLVEKYLNNRLLEKIPQFSLPEFMNQMINRKNELDGEIFELLLTFSDFLTFKEMILDYKAEKEGRTVDLSCGFTVTPLGTRDKKEIK